MGCSGSTAGASSTVATRKGSRERKLYNRAVTQNDSNSSSKVANNKDSAGKTPKDGAELQKNSKSSPKDKASTGKTSRDRAETKNDRKSSQRVVTKKDSTATTSNDRTEAKNDRKSSSRVDNSTTTKSNGRAERQYNGVDKHARKAPDNLRQSADDLVKYLSIPSKDPKMVVRAIFVWITENIAYDVDGYFGRAPKASCDAKYVMVNGRSVCEGYANVFDTLCRKANIPVKKISGYSKGYGWSADSSITTAQSINHAWNAVQLDGNWHLLDCTWAAGNVGKTSKEFEKTFDNHYFLTDPTEFVTNHFPYMDGDMAASMKWQLLNKPITLEEFSKTLMYFPSAFQSKVKPISHPDGLVTMNIEEEFTFTWHREEVLFTEELSHKQGSLLQTQPGSCFGSVTNGVYTVMVHPRKVGTFELDICGKKASDPDDKSYECLFTYVINCQSVSKNGFEVSKLYACAQSHKVKPISHPYVLVTMDIEEEFTFTWHGEEVIFNELLSHKQDSILQSQTASCYGSAMNGVYTVKVHPRTTGTFQLDICGKKASDPDDKKYDTLFRYVINCQKSSNDGFEFPKVYSHAQTHKVTPISHLNGLVTMNIEDEFTFTWHGEDIVFTEKLSHKQGSITESQPGSCFGSVTNGVYTVKVHPRKVGTFELDIYGKKASDPDDKNYDGLFTYVINCQRASNDGFEFPTVYTDAQTHQVTLLEPVKDKLPAEKTVIFRMKSSRLNEIMINWIYFTKTGSTFEGEIKTGAPGSCLNVFGSIHGSSKNYALYQYRIV